jgi:tetratricopeptide (TPR) repeat protein
MYFGLFSEYIINPIKRRKRIKVLLTELHLNKTNANNALELGRLYFEGKKYKESIEYLNRAQERIDNSARLHTYKGMSYMEIGECEKGREELLKALELDNSVIYGLPYIYLLRNEMSKEHVNREEVEKLEKSLDRYANTENFYRMGRIYKKFGDKQKALEMFKLSLRDYSYVQKKFRRPHRKWAFLSRFHRSLPLSISIIAAILIIIAAGFTTMILNT